MALLPLWVRCYENRAESRRIRRGAGSPVQALVYSFIALAAAAMGALAYFALAFTPANAVLVVVVVGCVCFVIVERQLRQRAERRLEQAIQELSRLLATDAQAGAVLGQRINALTDLKLGQRIDMLEADISVLGTVIRQVAEAVAEVEERVDRPAKRNASAMGDYMPAPVPEPVAPKFTAMPSQPVIPLPILRQAVADHRLTFHIQPVVRLPQRRPAGYDLLPRLTLENGDLAEEADFMPVRGGEDVVRDIEGTALFEAIAIARRSRATGQPVTLYIPFSLASLGDSSTAEQVLATLDANRAIAPGLIFLMSESQWNAMSGPERTVAETMARKGAGFSLTDVRSLRVDAADLAAMGVRSLRVNANRFIANPEAYTDFHLSDIASYLSRFDIALIAIGVSGEREIIELLDNEILLVKGDHLAPAGPIRPDLVLESARTTAPKLRRAEL